jgi:hypothetical protein
MIASAIVMTICDRLPVGCRPSCLQRSFTSSFFSVAMMASGLRVWYVLSSDPQRPRLFRADWTPPVAQPQRVLN